MAWPSEAPLCFREHAGWHALTQHGHIVRALLSAPGGGPSRQAIRRVGAAFRLSYGVGSRDSVLSRLNHMARTPAVYASQDGSLHHHATLASGCGQLCRTECFPVRGPDERFQQCIAASFPELS